MLDPFDHCLCFWSHFLKPIFQILPDHWNQWKCGDEISIWKLAWEVMRFVFHSGSRNWSGKLRFKSIFWAVLRWLNLQLPSRDNSKPSGFSEGIRWRSIFFKNEETSLVFRFWIKYCKIKLVLCAKSNKYLGHNHDEFSSNSLISMLICNPFYTRSFVG